jgi:hypothetical protein
MNRNVCEKEYYIKLKYRGMIMFYLRLYIFLGLALLLLGYGIFFNRKLLFGIVIGEIICTGFVSFYIFFNVYSYVSTPEDIVLTNKLTDMGDGNYKIDIHVSWVKKPQIKGLGGNDDLLIIRCKPQEIEVKSSDKEYMETSLGTSVLKLSKEYSYSKINKDDKDVYFHIKDGSDTDISTVLKILKPDASIKVFYIRDYKMPFEKPTYWEKDLPIEIKP